MQLKENVEDIIPYTYLLIKIYGLYLMIMRDKKKRKREKFTCCFLYNMGSNIFQSNCFELYFALGLINWKFANCYLLFYNRQFVYVSPIYRIKNFVFSKVFQIRDALYTYIRNKYRIANNKLKIRDDCN